MAQVDLAGSVPAQERAQGPVVTLAVNSFLFKEPVFVGDLVSFYAGVTKVGRASITVDGEVFAQRGRVGRSEAVKVTEAQLTYVAIDAQRHPRPVPAAVVEERAGNDWKQAISESIPLGARPCGRRGGRSPAAGMLSASGEARTHGALRFSGSRAPWTTVSAAKSGLTRRARGGKASASPSRSTTRCQARGDR